MYLSLYFLHKFYFCSKHCRDTNAVFVACFFGGGTVAYRQLYTLNKAKCVCYTETQLNALNAMAFYCFYFCTAYQWGYTETEQAAVTLGEPEMAATKAQRRTQNNGSSERVTPAAEGIWEDLEAVW